MSSTEAILADAIDRARRFEGEAHGLLGRHETSRSRVVLLGFTYDQLTDLSLAQDDLFRQGLRCVEAGLFKAAHVMAWAGFMDYLEEKLASDGLVRLRALRPRWPTTDVVELRESINERQLLDAAYALRLVSKNEYKALLALLDRRNECAHPSSWFPGLNETLGYVSELIGRIRALEGRAW